MKIVKGAAAVGTYRKTGNSHRKWCTKCGGHLLNEHPAWDVIDV